jgi:hypothetical protein
MKAPENEREKLVLALQLALNALQFYKDNTVYYYQTGLSDYGTECSDIAEIAINKIAQMDLEVLKK